MKNLVTLVLMLCCTISLSPLSAIAGTALERKVSRQVDRILENTIHSQLQSGSWQGSFESDPSIDVLFLVLGKTLGFSDSTLEQETLSRVFAWKGSARAWPNRPGGEPSLDVTGAILLGLERLGIDRARSEVSDAWSWFEAQGGIERLNLSTLLLLEPLGLARAPKSLQIPVHFFAVPKFVPVNILTVGITRSILIPLAVFQFYRDSSLLLGLDPERIASKGSHFGAPGKQPIKFFPGNFWAQEGLGWLLAHQQEDGPWYTFQMSLLTLAALHQAQKVGTSDFSAVIQKGWKGLAGMRRTNLKGEKFLPPSDSIGWDTPRTLVSLFGVPGIRDRIGTHTLQKGTEWLIQTQLLEKGDWAYLNPELAPGAWSFVPTNPYLPDTDVTATSLESLLLAQQQLPDRKFKGIDGAMTRGMNWLMGMQNKDGSYAAWEKGNTSLMPILMRIVTPDPPAFSDLGQPDVTSRILKVLSAYRDDLDQNISGIDHAIDQGCRFLEESSTSSSPQLWQGDWLVNYLYGTAEVVDALMATRCRSLQEVEENLAWIASKQHEDGGWGEAHSSYSVKEFVDAPSTIMQTAFIALPFLTYEKSWLELHQKPSAFRKNLDAAVSYLATHVKSDGEVSEFSHTGVMLKGQWYVNYAMSPKYETLKILGKYLDLTK